MSKFHLLEGQPYRGYLDEGQQDGRGQLSSTQLFPGYQDNASSAQTLLPGVDPITAAALVRTRQALETDKRELQWMPPRNSSLPALGDSDRLGQWSIEIRAQNLMTELMGPLRLTGDPDEQSFTVQHVESANAQPYVIAKIIRPPRRLFQEQVQLVIDMAAQRAERLSEIIPQIGIPIQFWAVLVDLNPTTTPYTMELISLAMAFGSAITQPCKHTLGCPRPGTYSPSVQPVINPRRFGAFPSGHAMEAFMTARLLQLVMGQKPATTPGDERTEAGLEQQLQRLAARIAVNRIVAGVHFDIDTTAGRMLGETLATYLSFRCGNNNDTPKWIERTFDGQARETWNQPFNRHDMLDAPSDAAPFFRNNKGTTYTAPQYTLVKNGKSLLHWLWVRAQDEWRVRAQSPDRAAADAKRPVRRKRK